VRWSGLAAVVGGLGIALFVLLHPWDRFVGAEVARSGQWRLAHTLHFVGAAFALLGLPGLYAHQRARLGPLGAAGFVVAGLGTAMFVGTGMLTAFVWPMVAHQAPAAVELGGAMFEPPALHALWLTGLVVIVGYLMFGAATLRAGVFPRAGTVALTAGAVLGMLPPRPLGALPWAGLVLGGVLFGGGLIWLGSVVWRAPAPTSEDPR
jgi:hypothetical protein